MSKLVQDRYIEAEPFRQCRSLITKNVAFIVRYRGRRGRISMYVVELQTFNRAGCDTADVLGRTVVALRSENVLILAEGVGHSEEVLIEG